MRRGCNKALEDGRRCNEPEIGTCGACYNHAHTCACGEPMHFDALVCDKCKEDDK